MRRTQASSGDPLDPELHSGSGDCCTSGHRGIQPAWHRPLTRRHTSQLRVSPSGTVLDRGLRGTLDLMARQTLAVLGPMRGYGLAPRIEQISGEALRVNQGTIQLGFVPLVQQGWSRAESGQSENNRRAKFDAITAAGRRQLRREAENRERIAAVIGRLLLLSER